MNTTRRGKLAARATGFCLLALMLAGLGLHSAPALACPGTTGGTTVQYLGCNASSGNGSSVQVTSPGGTQIGDYLLVAIATDANPNISAPAGWTLIDEGPASGSAARLGVFGRFAAAGGAQNYTFNLSSNEQYYGWIMRFANTSGVDPSEVSVAAGAALQADSPSVTTAIPNSMIVRLGGFDGTDTANNPGTVIGGHNNITQNSSGANAGGAAWVNQAAAGASGGAAFSSAPGCAFFFFFCWAAEEYRTVTLALRPMLPSFRIEHGGNGFNCIPNTIQITADAGDGSIETGYTGTIQLSTNTGEGLWAVESGSGTFVSGGGDGTASYTFAAADNGVVAFSFMGETGVVNFNVADGSRVENPLFDASLTVDDCVATVASGPLTCEITTGSSYSFTHTAGIPDDSTEDRMVLVFWGGRGGSNSPGSASFAGTAMDLVSFSYNGGGGNASAQMFAILSDDLPAAAGNYQVQVSGAASSYAVCAMTLTGVEQLVPQGDGSNLPVNSSISFNNTISTTITTQEDESYVVAIVGNNRRASYNHSLANELFDAGFGFGGNQAAFSVAAETIATASQITASSTASSENRQAQVLASFSPAPFAGPTSFAIDHDGTGDNCSMNSVTISAINGFFDPVEDYTGTITISDEVGTGGWVLVSGNPANFSDLGGGEASYTFTLADMGEVELAYSNTSTGNYNFSVIDGDMNEESPFFDEDLELLDCPNQVDHYAVSHAGFGISCLATPVAITPHTAAHAATDTQAGTVITLSTSNGRGTWGQPLNGAGAFSSVPGSGQASYAFLPGEQGIVFPFNYTDIGSDTESLTIQVIDNDVPSRIQFESPLLSFSRAGLRFFNETLGNSNWPTLVAGMPSSLTGQVLSVQAIRTSDDDPTACEPLFAPPAVMPVELAFECSNPVNCSAAAVPVQVLNNGTTSNILPVNNNGAAWVNESGFASVPLLFEDAGGYAAAQLVISYADAGAMQVHGRYNIPLEDGPLSGDFMVGSGAPNAALGNGYNFVVRPFAYDIDFSADRQTNGNTPAATSWATDESGSAFMVAGSDFATTVRAVSWQGIDDANLDGIPDAGADLFDNLPTPNYGNEIAPAESDVTLLHSLLAPAGGDSGTLQNGSFQNFAGGTGSETRNLRYSEVGIIDLLATLDSGNYLGTGQGISGTVRNVGRFYPQQFELLSSAWTPRENQVCSLSPFTYMGEEFGIRVELVAKNTQGDDVLNYRDGFAYLSTPDDLGLGAILDVSGAADEDYSMRLVNSSIPTDFTSLWTGGIADIEGNVIFNRASDDVPDGPFEGMQIVFVPIDSDGVTLDSVDVDLDDGITEPGTNQYRLIASHDFRYGRLLLRNAYGSELELSEGGSTLDIRLDVEYFNGSDFVINSLDDCTPYNSSEMSFVSGSFTDNLSPGDLSIVPASGAVFGGLNFENPANPDADDVPMLITPPGEGNDGSALVELDLEGLDLQFLSYEWRGVGELLDQNGDDSYDDNPRALVEFGSFRGHDRIINWQEVIQ